MGLSKITESPRQQRGDADPSERHTVVGHKGIQQLRIKSLESSERGLDTTCHSDTQDRDENQSEKHQRTLQYVGPTDSKKTTEKGVSQHRRRAPQHGLDVRNTEKRFEQSACGDKPRAGIEDEEQQNHDCR